MTWADMETLQYPNLGSNFCLTFGLFATVEGRDSFVSRSSNLQLEGTIPVCNSDAPNLNYISYHIQIVYTNIITIAITLDLYIDHDTCENDRTCCPQTKPPKVFRHFLGDLSKRSSDDFIIGSQGSQFLPACLSRIPGGWRVVKALDIDA